MKARLLLWLPRLPRLAVALAAVPVYGLTWLAAAACGVAYFGARAGWRDARTFTEGD